MDNAFKVVKDGQTFDYRIPATLNLSDITNFFSVHYKVISIQQTGRHVTGIFNDGSRDLFLKLATTQGISILTKNEFAWNEAFNKIPNPKLQVPKNVISGEYNGLFYSLTEKLAGQPLANPDFTLDPSFTSLIPEIINSAEYIMGLKITGLSKPDLVTGSTPQEWFLNKTKAWLDAIPAPTQSQHGLLTLYGAVESGAHALLTKPRHGDFTPWHMAKTLSGLALFDGEHAMSDGVELYDIGYLIQRVHTVSKSPDVALKLFLAAEKKGHPTAKLKTILAARAIGGFLDAHLANKTDLILETQFKDWAKSL